MPAFPKPRVAIQPRSAAPKPERKPDVESENRTGAMHRELLPLPDGRSDFEPRSGGPGPGYFGRYQPATQGCRWGHRSPETGRSADRRPDPENRRSGDE